MATTRYNPSDYRRSQMGSPRPKGRDNKDTFCRNILIYGHCRYQDSGCTFNHDQNKKSGGPKPPPTEPGSMSSKKQLNVESAPFTPATAPPQGPAKKTFSSSHAASAAVFTPRASAASPASASPQPPPREMDLTSTPGMPTPATGMASTPGPATAASTMSAAATSASVFNNVGSIREFTPSHQGYDLSSTNGTAAAGVGPTAGHDAGGLNYDPFSMGAMANAMPAAPAFNPYANNAFYPGGHPAWGTMQHAPVRSTQEPPNTALVPVPVGPLPVHIPSVFGPIPAHIPAPLGPNTVHIPTQFGPIPAQLVPANTVGTHQGFAQSSPIAPRQIPSHYYAQIGPYRDHLEPWQRSTYDFFMTDNLREEIHKKTHASLQVMPPSQHQLPNLDHYHSLVPLDKVAARKTTSIFKYTSWAYKATSSKTGRLYCLRRLEGFKLSSEEVLRPVKDWKKISNGNVVTMHDAFTSRAFGESSLVFAQDYHPMSETLAEHHFANLTTNQFRGPTPATESMLWSYIVQIANALKTIHDQALAARCIDINKIILTDKNRIRLSACGILDVVQYEQRRNVKDLQQEDFVHLGRVIVSLATNTLPSLLDSQTLPQAVEQLSRNRSKALRETVLWLLTIPPSMAANNPNNNLGASSSSGGVTVNLGLAAGPNGPGATVNIVSTKTIENFLSGINHHMVSAFDAQLHRSDTLFSELFREVENGRVARLVLKLGTINERLEYEADPRWSENGDRYLLKLFRDYVFHQVDAGGAPVLDLGHMLRALNKLDAGVDERIRLTSRDGETDFVVSFKELHRAVNGAFAELQKGSSSGAGGGGAGGSGGGGNNNNGGGASAGPVGGDAKGKGKAITTGLGASGPPGVGLGAPLGAGGPSTGPGGGGSLGPMRPGGGMGGHPHQQPMGPYRG